MARNRGETRDRRRPRAAPRRGASRTTRHARQSSRAARQPATARRHSLTFTSRAAVLGLVLCAAVLTLAYPTKQLFAQRSSNAAQAQQAAQLKQQIAQLSAQDKAAQNPAVIEQQARERLHYALPGQRNYIALTPPAAAKKPVAKAGNAALPADDGGTWFGRLWDTDQTAGS